MVASIEDMNREKAVMNQTAREVQEASSAMIKYYLYIFFYFYKYVTYSILII